MLVIGLVLGQSLMVILCIYHSAKASLNIMYCEVCRCLPVK